jgi:hypothetical protein
MDDNERGKIVEAVQRQIAFLLADLEKRTGGYVDEIGIHSTEVTKIDDSAPRFLRRVVVDLRRVPGSYWNT